MNKEELDNLSEELGNEIYNSTIHYDEITEEYYQIVGGEEDDERITIDSKYYPVIERYL